jgi:hypothetical protein
MEEDMKETDSYKAGEQVVLRAVRTDIVATVVEHEGDLVSVRIDGSGQVVSVPAGVIYREQQD